MVVSLLVVILPTAGNPAVLHSGHLWILTCMGILASLLQPAYNPFRISSQKRDRYTGAQIVWSVYITQVAAVLEAAYYRYPQSIRWDFTACAALVFAILGLVFRTWSVSTLGKFFTMHLDIQTNHTVIRSGPYRFLRHPSYLGALVMCLASITFLHAWFSLAAALVLLPIAFVRRVHYEEMMLKKGLGDEYSVYCQKTKKILPWIW
jgi:protein-S-isoprenylcysteine O-methyltransferase